MSPRFVLGRENVPCVAEVVKRSLKADCTDFTPNGSQLKLCLKIAEINCLCGSRWWAEKSAARKGLKRSQAKWQIIRIQFFHKFGILDNSN